MHDQPEPGAPIGIDTLLPADMAREAEAVGVRKARLDGLRLFVLAVLGGAFIGLGAMFATTVTAGADGQLPWGLTRLLAGVPFSLGLMLVVLGGAELFTGNTLMVMALAAGRIGAGDMLRAWTIVYLGNFTGALATAGLVVLSGQALAGKGLVAAAALGLAQAKLTLPFGQAFFLGILCNVLVCLAVWLSIGARTTSGKVLAVLFPVSAFVAAGFEHSVANMYIIPVGLLLRDWAPPELLAQAGAQAAAESLSWGRFFVSLVPVTLGNVVGGGALVGGVYWFVYLRGQSQA
jgi:formate transporter